MGDGEHAHPPFGRGLLQPAATSPSASTSSPESTSSRTHDARAEHAELHHLGALALAAREVDVERPAQQRLRRGRPPSASSPSAASVAEGGAIRRRRRRPRPAARQAARPGTSTGCCSARNSPARARCQAGSPTSSCPSMVMEPSVTSVPGRPISAWASVLLPEPLGPMIDVDLPAAHREVDAVQHLPAAGRRVQARRPRRRARRSRQHHRHVAVRPPRPRTRPRAAWPAASRGRRSAGRTCCRAGGTRSRTRRPRPRPRTASSPHGCTRRPMA